MYVARVPNRSSPPAGLLREKWREVGKVKSRTLANLTHWPEAKVEALRRVLRGEPFVAQAADRCEIERSLPHGHVAAVLGTLRRIGLDRLLPRRPERVAKLALALIVARVIEPAGKLATARQLSEAAASHSLGAVLGLGEVDEDELYRVLDVLGAAQPAIERALARRHLEDGTLVLYDVTSSYLVERAFRALKSIDLEVRPVHHRLAGRVRAHVFLCMLACYVAWHMRRKLAPLLFEDHDRPAAAAARPSPVAVAEVSPAARAKARTRKTDDGVPLHGLRTLLADLATLTRNTVRFGNNLPMTVLSRPTPPQQRAFDYLGVAIAP
jgi:hypothetical protein